MFPIFVCQIHHRITSVWAFLGAELVQSRWCGHDEDSTSPYYVHMSVVVPSLVAASGSSIDGLGALVARKCHSGCGTVRGSLADPGFHLPSLYPGRPCRWFRLLPTTMILLMSKSGSSVSLPVLFVFMRMVCCRSYSFDCRRRSAICCWKDMSRRLAMCNDLVPSSKVFQQSGIPLCPYSLSVLASTSRPQDVYLIRIRSHCCRRTEEILYLAQNDVSRKFVSW